MSDGDGKEIVKFPGEKDSQELRRKNKKSGIDEFSQAIARIAVAQVCESVGFQSFQQSALDTFADVGVRYIREIGKLATFYANLANRSQCNVFDVIQGLEDLGSAQGFSGASDAGHSLSGSGVVRDIIHYVGRAEEVPFAYLVPGIPVVKERRLNPTFAQAEEDPPCDYIPHWLPKFPDPGSYADLHPGNEKDLESGVESKFHQVEPQHKKVERPLMDLHHKIFNGSEAGFAVEQGDAAKAKRAAESNPFLAPPLQHGEKEIYVPIVPAKLLDEAAQHHRNRGVLENHGSAVALSLPHHEAVGSCEPEPEDRRTILLNGRPHVQFKFGNSKRSLPMGTSPCTDGSEKISFWFADDHDGKDGKKRSGKILLENMEYHQEVSHL